MDMVKELSPALLVITIGLLVYLLKFLANDFWQDAKERGAKWETLINQNTMALLELKIEMKHIVETFQNLHTRVENIEDDLDAAHDKLRRNSIN